MRWFRRLLVFVVLVALVVGLAGVWIVRRSFPVIDGQVAIPGLEGSVTIRRDDAGIPHIVAASSHDLFLAQGYTHAQDRFWQMDTWRHIGAGRLSEMFGDSQVDTDSFLRTLGFESIAEAEYAAAPAETRAALDAYAAGVNAYLDERPGGSSLSLEYAVLGLQSSGYTPEAWDPVDSLTWGHVMAWDLRSNVNAEIERAMVSGAVGLERTEQLYPPYPPEHPFIVSDDETEARSPAPAVEVTARAAIHRTASNLSAVEAVLGRAFEGIGSNSWVVAGSHTESGMPLLANDPHLGIQMPSIWYQAVLWCEEVSEDCPYRVTGFTFPGAPGVVVGHNERIAWGVTNLGPDTMDLFIERTDGDRYQVEGEWVEMDSRTELIEVAGGDPVELEIRSTRHGPIISGRYGDLDDLDQGGLPLPDRFEVALAWRALEPSTLFQSLLAINTAGNWEEFREAASMFDIASQNLVYADVDGHIGYQATGAIPIRRAGDGRYPVPGWDSEYEWTGYIPFADLPHVLDPPAGVIVTANQPVVGATYDGLIGIDHAYGYRAQRITELLDTEEPIDVALMEAIQMDGHDASAALIVPAVSELTPDDPAIEAMQTVLDEWAGGSEPFQMDAGSPGAAAHAAVWRHLLELTFDELPEDHAAGGNGRYFEAVRLLLGGSEDPWWDDESTSSTETSNDILRAAVIAAHDELTRRLGDPDDWSWGELHLATFSNQTLGVSGIAPIEMLFNRTAPPRVGGGAAIVNATSWSAPEGYEVTAVPSFRMVVDLDDLSRSTAIHTTGQSGHAFHGNYFDMAEPWSEGAARALPFDPSSFPAVGTLTLDPG